MNARQRIRKFGFTLMEVNLAIFIMAAGVLAMVSLYPLGYRENQQSRDDVWAACEADRIFNQIHAALSERTIEWDTWLSGVKNLKTAVGDWGKYCETDKGWAPRKKSAVNGLAVNALNILKGIARDAPPDLGINGKRVYAIVAQPGFIRYNGEVVEDYSRIVISMRIARSSGSLFAQPIYLTEVHFQGDQEKR